jgi:hypothetical protein
MRDLMFKNRPVSLLTMLILALGLTLTGCSDDDDDGGNNPTGPSETQFDEAFVTQQATTVVPLAVSQIENILLYVDGVGNKAEENYTWGWNGDQGRWEGSYSGSEEGMTFSYEAWLQYLDALGDPQQEALGAASMAYYTLASLIYSFTGDGTSVDMNYDIEENMSATGLGTDTVVINGDSMADLDYTWSSENGSGNATYSYSWQILSPGIAYPLAGCPSGTIEFTMAPYTVTVVFDGSDTATYTITENGTVIPGGTGSTPLSCTTAG